MAMEQSLFGPSVAGVRDQLMQQDISQTNGLTLQGMAGMAGGLIGRGLGNLAGLEDPRVAKAKAMEEVKNELRQEGIDATTPDEFYPRLIKKLNSKGLTEEAMNVANAYRSQSMDSALKTSQIEEHVAKAGSAGREKLSTLGKLQAEYADAVVKKDSKKISELEKAITLETQGKLEKITEGAPGKGDDWVRDVYKDSFGNVVITGEPYKKTPQVSIDTRASTADELERARVGGDSLKDWRKAVTAATEMKPTLQKLSALTDNKNLITGGYADFKTAIAKFVGVPLGDDPSALKDSQVYDALVQNVILPQIRLFAPVSDYDVEALKRMYGDRKLEPEAIKAILKFAEEKINRTLKTNERLGAFLKNKGKLSEWDFGTGMPLGESATSAPEPAQSSSPTPAPQPSGQRRYAIPPQQYESELRALGKLSEDEIQKRLRRYYPEVYK